MAEDKKTSAQAVPTIEDHRLIVRPIITEKSTWSREKLGKYTFEVAKAATKHNIGSAIERLFNVKVRKVNVFSRPGKMRRVRSRAGWTNDTKRAIVTVEAGQKIAFFEGI